MDERLKANLEAWNMMAGIHAASREYRLAEFKAGENVLKPIELREVGDVRGKSLLHMQCHFGLDTLSWARMGADGRECHRGGFFRQGHRARAFNQC
jgi:hypothetical protein